VSRELKSQKIPKIKNLKTGGKFLSILFDLFSEWKVDRRGCPIQTAKRAEEACHLRWPPLTAEGAPEFTERKIP